MAKEIRLQKLVLRNFKGIREFTLDAAGGDVSVYGDNATGKTTLADAFMWLLFDKDSQNRATFEIKTLGPDGQPIHNLEHEVEGVLEADGRQITLRKVFKEKWTRKRGSATAEFTGHTTDYYIDGVPVQKGEYTRRVGDLVDENVFRLLTDPRYFNEVLHWQERRKILLQVCGDVSDADVIASSDALAELPEILGHRTIEEHRKVIAARRREINQELERIPVRIDEATKAMPDVEVDAGMIRAEIDRLTEAKRALEEERSRIDHGAQVVELQRQAASLDVEMLKLKQRLAEQTDRSVANERTRLMDLETRANGLRLDINRLQVEIRDDAKRIEAMEQKLAGLRAEWRAIRDREFALSVDEVCPACGQALPADRVEAARQRALEEFNARKSADLEANQAEGRALKAQLDDLLAAQDERARKVDSKQNELAAVDQEIARVRERIDQLRQAAPDPTQHPEYQRLVAQKADLQRQVDELKASSAGAKAVVQGKIDQVEAQISALQGELARIEQRHQLEVRIEELKAQEKALAAEFERLERELYLTEEFIRAKVRLLEERINSRFRIARFKLFNQLVNGGLEECCETMAAAGPGQPLVPYSILNNGARINVGLDVIRTLSEHYGFHAPILIDNAESVTTLVPVDSQVIRLVVSEADKALRVMHHERIESIPTLTKEAV
ncbi:hypothetical protein [Symbiobacterium terraclitae]|uniref:hypothetical protein n=1 Tax=Symbiobacterium terraclitae TaxID=557451 RepID=UPI0035B536B5